MNLPTTTGTQSNRHTKNANPENNTPQFKEALRQIGIIHLEAVTTKQASAYLSQIKGIPTAASSLEVYRCQSRGPKYRKIQSRIFYSLEWLDEWASGVEVKIFDPSKK
jgi:hypothetical protein